MFEKTGEMKKIIKEITSCLYLIIYFVPFAKKTRKNLGFRGMNIHHNIRKVFEIIQKFQYVGKNAR